jgi:hypothetical protein
MRKRKMIGGRRLEKRAFANRDAARGRTVTGVPVIDSHALLYILAPI